MPKQVVLNMLKMIHNWRLTKAMLIGVLSACQPAEPSAPTDVYSPLDAGTLVDSGTEPPEPQRAFTHKMMKRTGENMFSILGYECNTCSFEQHAAIVSPQGWTKGPTQVSAFTHGELRSHPSFDGVPDAMDFVEEVPGDEYKLIVKTVSGELLEQGANGIVARTEVMRDTRFTYAAGRRVHELTSPGGDVFVLFAFQVDPSNPVIPDFEDPEVLGDFGAPEGWTYSSRILDEELVLDTPQTATVLAIRKQTDSTWQLR